MKTTTSIVLLTVILFSSQACSKKDPDAQPVPIYQTGSAPREIQKQLFVQNVSNAVENKKDYEFVGIALAQELAVVTGTALNSQTDYLTQLEYLDKSAVLQNGPLLLDHYNAIDAGQLTFSSSAVRRGRLSTLNVLQALHEYEADVNDIGAVQAKILFEEKLKKWTPGILAAAHDAYLSDTQGQFRSYLDKSIQAHLQPQFPASFMPNGSVPNLAAGLPENTESLKAIKLYLMKKDVSHLDLSAPEAKSDFEDIAKKVVTDLSAAHREVRELIGSPQLTTEEKKLKYGAVFHKLDASVELAGMFMDKVLGKSKEAQDFVRIAASGVRIAKAVTEFKFAAIGANIATGNILGAASDIISGLSGLMGLGAPDIEDIRHQEVMGALKDIRNDINEFKNKMVERFDQVDKKLQAISEQLDTDFKSLQESNKKLANSILDLRTKITALSNQVEDLEFITISGFNDLFDNEFALTFAQCLGDGSRTVNDALGAAQDTQYVITQCLNVFENRANSTSRLKVRSFDSDNLKTDKLKLEALTRPSLQNPKRSFGVLLQAMSQMGLVGFPLDDAVQINLLDWLVGTESYLTMRMLFPKTAFEPSRVRVTAKGLQNTVMPVIKAMRLMGSANTLKSLANRYENDATMLLDRARDFKPAADSEVARKFEEETKMLGDQLGLERVVLDQLFQLTRPADRFSNPQLAIAFGNDLLALPSGEDFVRVIFENESEERLEHIGALNLRRNVSMIAIMSYLNDALRAGRDEPTQTVLDPTIEALSRFEQACEAH